MQCENLSDKKGAATQHRQSPGRHAADVQTCGVCRALAQRHRQRTRSSQQSRRTGYHTQFNTESLKLRCDAGQHCDN